MVPITTYLAPFPHFPLHWAVDHVAELLGARRRLRAQVRPDGQRVPAATGHLVDAMNLSGLHSTPAGSGASGEIARVPSRWAGYVIACPGDGIRTPVHGAQVRAHSLAIRLPDALNYRLLHSW